MNIKIILVIGLIIALIAGSIFYFNSRDLSSNQIKIDSANLDSQISQDLLKGQSNIIDNTISPKTTGYRVFSQTGLESFYDVEINKVNDTAFQAIVTFNDKKRIAYVDDFLNRSAKIDPNNLSAAIEALNYLNYVPPVDMNSSKDIDSRSKSSLTRELVKSPDNKEVTFEPGDTYRYVQYLNPYVDDFVKIGDNSIIIIADSTYASTDTNVSQDTKFARLNTTTVSPYDKLLLYYSFDGDRNNLTAFDLSKYSNDKSYTGGANIINTTKGCIYDDCLNLTLTTDYIDIGDLNTIEGVPQLTWSFWAYISTFGSGDSFMSKMTLFSAGSWKIGMISASSCSGGSGNELITYIAATDGDSTNNICTAGLSTGTWAYYTIVFNGSATGNANRLKTYINGTNIAHVAEGGTIPASIVATASSARIGRDSTTGEDFQGYMDEVMIFNMSLSDQQVLDIYNNQSSRFFSRGEMYFDSINLQENNTANITIQIVEANLGSNVSLSLNGGSEVNVDINGSGSGNVYNYAIPGNTTSLVITSYSNQTFSPVPNNLTQKTYLGDLNENTYTFTDTKLLPSHTCYAQVNGSLVNQACANTEGNATADPYFLWNITLPSDITDLWQINITSITAETVATTDTLNLSAFNINTRTWDLLNSSAGSSSVGVNVTIVRQLNSAQASDYWNSSSKVITVMSRVAGGNNVDMTMSLFTANISYQNTSQKTQGGANLTIVLKSDSTYNFYTPNLGGNITINSWFSTVTPPANNTCSYTSGNWNVACNDNCTITTNINLAGNNITINGTGTFTLNGGNITGYRNFNIFGVSPSQKCNLYARGGRIS